MDLTNPANWSIVYQANLQGNLVAVHGEGVGAIKVYDPIPTQSTSLGSPVGLVKTSAPSDEIKPDWFTACWINAGIELIPGNPTNLLRKRCGLNQSTLIELPNVGKFPYQIKFQIPKWLISLQIQLWQFTDESGRYVPLEDSLVWTAVEVVEQRQQILEQLIRQGASTNL